MSFYVPREFAEDTPQPTAPDVYIKHQPAMTVYVKTFGGYANDERCMEEMKKFIPILEEDGLRVRDDVYYFASYDSPWKFVNRRNEVWLVKMMESAGREPPSASTSATASAST